MVRGRILNFKKEEGERGREEGREGVWERGKKKGREEGWKRGKRERNPKIQIDHIQKTENQSGTELLNSRNE